MSMTFITPPPATSHQPPATSHQQRNTTKPRQQPGKNIGLALEAIQQLPRDLHIYLTPAKLLAQQGFKGMRGPLQVGSRYDAGNDIADADSRGKPRHA
jgi:hypothetical protein